MYACGSPRGAFGPRHGHGHGGAALLVGDGRKVRHMVGAPFQARLLLFVVSNLDMWLCDTSTGSVAYASFPQPEALKDQAAEPSLGINRKTGAALFMAGQHVSKVTFDSAGTKATWIDVTSPISSINSLDAILFSPTRRPTARLYMNWRVPAASL